MNKLIGAFLAVFFLIPAVAAAHQPVLETSVSEANKEQGFYFRAIRLEDPTQSSLAVYGSILAGEDYDLYAFVPIEDATIPVELLVPVSAAQTAFKPHAFIIAKDLQERTETTVPFEIPPEYQILELRNGRDATFYEPFGAERYYSGDKKEIAVQKGRNYFIAVLDAEKNSGSYVLSIGDKENFSEASYVGLAGNVIKMKLGLAGNPHIPWLDFWGLFIFMAGLAIGLGAVTVIDLHGLLGLRSGYWTEATIRSHKITKPLIWFGVGLVIIGGAVLYRASWLNGVALFQLILVMLLILNGLFLSFWISPRLHNREKEGKSQELLPLPWKKAIAASFIISFLGWWSTLGLLAWYLIMQR